MKRIIIGVWLVLLASSAWALPTLPQVEAEVQKGNYSQAETMMGEVVAAKPDSARAHYIYAEVLARNGNFSKASDEAAKAQQIDPQLGFTDPAKFRAFQSTLQREQNPPSRARGTSLSPTSGAPAFGSPAAATRSGVPGWMWLAGLAVLAYVVYRLFARRTPGVAGAGNYAAAGGPAGGVPNAYPQGGPMNPNAPYGYNNAPAGGQGSSMLKTGLAAGAGAAGGVLLGEMLSHHGSNANNLGGGLGPDNYDPSANDAASQLENRPVDFGQGGDDWDSGGGGSIDTGGDSGGGGGWD